nr:PKD domain-containing protein [Candidatus Njordarchaeum guaymaensis]
TLDWDWGVSVTEGNPHIFEAAGTYTVTLTVTDIEGLNNADWKTIAIEPRDALIDITPYLTAATTIVILSGVGVYLIRNRKSKKSPKQIKGKSPSARTR